MALRFNFFIQSLFSYCKIEFNFLLFGQVVILSCFYSLYYAVMFLQLYIIQWWFYSYILYSDERCVFFTLLSTLLKSHNKLLLINPTLGEWKPTFRKSRGRTSHYISITYCHTRITHSFILKQEEQLQSMTCHTP